MRIISQNGKLDFPYENIVVEIMDNVIVAYTPMTSPLRMAQYKSQEKAEKAMQKLHDRYSYLWKIENDKCSYYENSNVVFRFPQENKI